MKRLAAAIIALLALAGQYASAEIISQTKIWSAVGTNTATWVNTSAANEVQVTVKGNGSQDGTVTIYVCPVQTADTCVSVGTYAASTSTASTVIGSSSAFVYVTLTGNTPATGSIDAYVVAKR